MRHSNAMELRPSHPQRKPTTLTAPLCPSITGDPTNGLEPRRTYKPSEADLFATTKEAR